MVEGIARAGGEERPEREEVVEPLEEPTPKRRRERRVEPFREPLPETSPERIPVKGRGPEGDSPPAIWPHGTFVKA